ncbi:MULTISPECIES: HAD-IIIC family phosphatase [unclassified Ensifer]|uniref:HAD-IIIC family phosphatase n=1 Tax=unclassified Ensifer TaxID=2633371 RepID=UPI000AB6EAF7|nr:MULTISPECIES: HAD-IIIC family phosphatase [unclassified Ensifer]
MSCDLFLDLAWLPRPPAEFKDMCRRLAGSASGAEIQHLASFALDANQAARLARVIRALQGQNRLLSPLTPVKLGILANGTIDLAINALAVAAARHGILLECVTADYGMFIQEALDPASRMNAARCDVVLLALDYRAFPFARSPGNAAAAAANIEEAISLLNRIRDGISASGAICILQTLAPPVEALFGSLDRSLPGTPRHFIDGFNRRLLAGLEGTTDILLDVAAIAETVGLANWHSPSHWNLAKLPFADGCVPFYADHVARLLAAMRGKARRCLVLDLDNTLWGGVVGDDSLHGIMLAEGDAVGEAYRSVQCLALALRERGIVLAVSSKNTDEVARRVFREHPEMLIREEQIAVFQANWDDKATNIKAIAGALSLGLESMVLLDDNPAERGLVRQILPQVAVPELPDDPALFARTLAAAGYFEATIFSDEDRRRAAYYEGNAHRVELQERAGDIDSYLASLEMEITFRPFDRTGRSRIAQLINKSNQFNLTTRRYTEAEVAAIENDPSCTTLQVRLADRFGDNGMISVVICRTLPEATWEIDTWLMSCRVLGRRAEQMVLREILRQACEAGIRTLVGIYRPTDRNAMVRDHYAKLGFTQVAAEEGSTSRWMLDTATEIGSAPMRINRALPADLHT